MTLEINAKGLISILSGSIKETKLARLFSGEDAVRTPDESLLFIKKIVAIAASNILYLRNAFPDNAFKNFTCDDGLQLNLLYPVQLKNNSKAVNLIDTFLTVLDGVEKKYVEKLQMIILYRDGNEIAVTEIYAFHFDYKEDVKLTISKKSETGNSDMNAVYIKDSKQLIANTRALIRQIQTTCLNNDAIPEDAEPKVRLTVVYTDNTPENYQLPGFSACKTSFPTNAKLRENQWLGHVSTQFHSMKLEDKILEGESDYFNELYE